MTQLEPQSREVTLESLSARLDIIGKQMDWLCENMSGLFQFLTQMGQNGGGIRGMMKTMKDMPAVNPKQAALKAQLMEEGELIERYQSGG